MGPVPLEDPEPVGEVHADLTLEREQPDLAEVGLVHARVPQRLEPVAEGGIAVIVQPHLGGDVFEQTVDVDHGQIPRASQVRASSSGSDVVGTRKNSSAPASRALSTARRSASGVKQVTAPPPSRPRRRP